VTQPAGLQKHREAGAVRGAAVVALLAIVVGRAMAPAVRGAAAGIDRMIRWTDFAGALLTYLFAIVGTAVLLRQVALLYEETKLAPVRRYLSAALAAAVAAFVLTATVIRLRPTATLALAVLTLALAAVAAHGALRVARTRALGVMLAATAMASALHVCGAWLAGWAGERARYSVALFAQVLGTATVGFDLLALLTALVWLATRGGTRMTWGTRIAIVAAFVAAWAAVRGAADNAAAWQVVAHRALDRFLVLPMPYGIPTALRYFIEALAPMLGVVALARRREMPGIVGGFALVLIARPTPDIPLCALGLALAATAATLASKDERGMWAVLMSRS
jgi:hypothetical protein